MTLDIYSHFLPSMPNVPVEFSGARLRTGSTHRLIKRAPIIYARSRNCGKLSARMVSAGVAEVVLSEQPNLTPPELRTLGVGIQCILELTGRRDVQVSCELRADGGRYVFRWRP